MIERQARIYYCEHCGHRRLARWAMERHEKHCTLNPDRSCRMCVDQVGMTPGCTPWIKTPTRDYRTLVDELEHKEIFLGEAEIDPEAVYDLAEGCPACALTILRLWRKKYGHKYAEIRCELNYKDEVRKWWAARAEEALEAEEREL